MKPCAVCMDADPETGFATVCEGGQDFHSLCRACAGSYLTTTLFSQSGVPAVGERVRCVGVGCAGTMDVDDLARGQPEAERRRVREQIARSTIRGMSPDADVVFCGVCDEFYLRESPGDSCSRCSGRGTLTAAYVRPPAERDDPLSAELVRTTTTPCPRCRAPISRTGGCNHMTCSVCSNQFCYVCGTEWGRGPPFCTPYLCSAARAERDRARAEQRRRARAAREAAPEADVACPRCATTGASGSNCPHMPLRPRRPSCTASCPLGCNCRCSALLSAWISFRQTPTAPPDVTSTAAMERVTVAHLAYTRVSGARCAVCGLRGHRHDAVGPRRHCPVLALAELDAAGP